MAVDDVYTVGYSLFSSGELLEVGHIFFTVDEEPTDPTFEVTEIDGAGYEGIATVTQLTEGTPPASGGYLYVVSTSTLFEQTTDFIPAGSAPEKAINPTPADANSNTSRNTASLTWEDGGQAESYDVYFGTESGNLTQVEDGIADTSANISTYNPLGFSTIYYWRVDSINGYGTTTGDEWSFYVVINPVTYARYSYYDEDKIYDEDTGTWVTADGSAGSRLQTNLVAIGQNDTGQGVVYYA
jgi:hypothetical protein